MSVGTSIKTWRLQSKLERRFKSGHPWVYSNELQGSPKGIEPGQPIVLCDAGGAFLAHGYGSPSSLIAFRVVSRVESEIDATAPSGVARRMARAWAMRRALGFGEWSCRLVFGEADELPGLIVDRYINDKGRVAVVVQAQSAGADRWTRQGPGQWGEIWDEFCKLSGFAADAVVIKNDSSARKWEGLEIEAPRMIAAGGRAGLSERELSEFALKLRPGVVYRADLVNGQKTGFFLDQWQNTQQFIGQMLPALAEHKGRAVRILDLCCYVGQWSAQLVHALSGIGVQSEVVLMDASKEALELAERNVLASARQGFAPKVQKLCGNVLKDLGELEAASFDVVISDPPALIKARKDIPTGTHAYLQLHTQALRLVSRGGFVAACSCSGLLSEEAFTETLAKAARRNGLVGAGLQWVARGGQSPDHPVLASFAEGRYLKAWLGRVEGG